MTERNMQQMIEGWRDDAETRGMAESESIMRLFRRSVKVECADEASVFLERLRAEIAEWRRKSEVATGLGLGYGSAKCEAYKECADALEQILGPEPSGGGK